MRHFRHDRLFSIIQSCVRPVAGLLLLGGLFAVVPCFAGEYEAGLLEQINAYRTSRKLPPLSPSARLEKLAREHSRSMRKRETLSHDGFEGRFERSGSRACVENVGWNHPTPGSQFTGWKESTGHDRNMLSREIVRAGIARDGAYVTFFACN